MGYKGLTFILSALPFTPQLNCSVQNIRIADNLSAKVYTCPANYKSNPFLPRHGIQNLVAEFEFSKSIETPDGKL